MTALGTDVESGAFDIEERAEARFREIADDASTMMWRADDGGRLVWFNRPWLDFVGRPAERELGEGWKAFVHPDDAEMSLPNLDEAIAHRAPFNLRYRVRAADGSWRWIVDSGRPIFVDDRFDGYRGSRLDVTELLELRLHKDVLLSELHHRVKNNLQLIIAFLSVSASRAEGDEARGLLTTAIRRVQGVGAVQEQLHRKGGGTVDLAEYLPSVARMVAGDDAAGPMVLLIDVEQASAPFPQAASLGLIVSELVSEAARDSAAGAPIVLRLARLGDDWAELIVTGGGPSAVRADTLVAALARHAKATVTRPPRDGGLVRLVFPLSPTAAGDRSFAEPNRGSDVFSASTTEILT